MSETNFKVLAQASQYFSIHDMPFLQEFKEYMRIHTPFRGLKIIHNTHLTMSTLCKIEALAYSGAQLDVTITADLTRDKAAMELLLKSGVNFIEENDLINDYDIVLDCCAGLYNKITPRVGAVELTQTGTAVYKSHPLSYPVFSIDDSTTKNLENFYGTGNGFIRAFKTFVTEESFRNKKFVIFGFGKVGRGIVHHLKQYTSDIVVVDCKAEKLTDAIGKGFKGLYADDITSIQQALDSTFCVVTATGVRGLLSQVYDKAIFNNVKFFANIGDQDEFGDNFTEAEVLFNKKPINFSLNEPTFMRYLDPVFYLHNLAVEVLLSNKRNPGVYSFPIQRDLSIMNRWSKIHKEETQPITNQQEIQHSESFLKNLLSYIPCYVYWKSPQSVYKGCNLLFAKAAGFDHPDDIIGKTDYDLAWGKTQADLFRQGDQEVLQGNPKINFYEDQYQADGKTKRVLASKVPYFNENNQLEGLLGIYMDITDKLPTAEFEQEQFVMHEKMKALRLMAASVAHEVRTPLATINAQSGFMKATLPALLSAYEYALTTGKAQPLSQMQLETLKELPAEINRSTSNANTFINMLLAKVNFDGSPNNSRPLTLLSAKDALIEAIDLYPLDEFSAAMIKTNYACSFEFMGDDILFRHVIFNLLKNAIFYVRSKPEGGQIQIWCEQQIEWNIIHFKDTGLGINPEVLPHIFNSFYTRTHHGTGVGLAFCKMTMEGFGGKISCESVEGQYAHFMLSFPKSTS